MKVTQIALGRFHHFHLARQLQKYDRLNEIWTGYPRAKLKDEVGIPRAKIKTFPWFYVPSQLAPRFGISPRFTRILHWEAVNAIDRHVARRMNTPTVLVGLSSGGLYSGRRAKLLGGNYICDRGSTHIRFQDSILREEYRIWGMEFIGVDPKVIDKEESEYALADRITVPSKFCYTSFIDAGIAPEKLRVIPYGGRLDRFSPKGEPKSDEFNVLFVGQVSIRKGIPYLLEAFAKLNHPRKRLKIIGYVPTEMEALLRKLPMENVELLGIVSNQSLAMHYSTADVMVLPSLEEGLALVMAEAMACGCPVIASENTGALDLFTDGVEGRIVPIRSKSKLVEALDEFAQNRLEALRMREIARARIQTLGGYDRYGAQWYDMLNEMEHGRQAVSSSHDLAHSVAQS
jgi:glycosyltransferase involved in cell wall biosynthesis